MPFELKETLASSALSSATSSSVHEEATVVGRSTRTEEKEEKEKHPADDGEHGEHSDHSEWSQLANTPASTRKRIWRFLCENGWTGMDTRHRGAHQ